MLNFGLAMGNLMGIPTLADLERHYMELEEQRRKMVEILERTDRIMAGVKRGIDEMRGVVTQQAPAPPSTVTAATPAAAPQVQQLPEQPAPAPQELPQQLEEKAHAQSQEVVASSESAVPIAREADPDHPRESVWPIAEEPTRD
jgi:hypothetical protein